MSTQAQGTFEVTGWDEDTYETFDGGAKLTRARISQDFAGDLVAKGTWESLMCYREDGTANYIGLEHVHGRIGDREGDFILETIGIFDGTKAMTTWSIVPDSATGELRGLRMDGTTEAGHGSSGTYRFDYEFV